MEQDYSIAIYPSEKIIELVKSMKLQLADEVGWFHSKNSVGHITICEIKSSEKNIERIKKQLAKICDTFEPFEVYLNSFGSYPNGAFFISPDKDSENLLKPVMKKVQDSLPIRHMLKSDNPHLSIARQLSPEKLKRAKQLFTGIDVRFLCESIVLRKFDENIKQFFVTDTFKFNSNPYPEGKQGILF